MGLWKKLIHRHPPKSALKLGRNEPCWCGSGRKYKKCHYESDRRFFDRFETCKTSS